MKRREPRRISPIDVKTRIILQNSLKTIKRVVLGGVEERVFHWRRRKKERRKEGKKERKKEGKKERRKERKKERKKEGKKERKKKKIKKVRMRVCE